MREPRLHNNTETAERRRLEYSAVPLAPWNAAESNHVDNLYSIASMARIERKLVRTMVDQEWFKNEPLAHEVYELMKISLIDSQFQRLSRNSRLSREEMVAMHDERADHAMAGVATPEEIFTFIADRPDVLETGELGKISHPCDYTAAQDLKTEIDTLRESLGVEPLSGDPRYKVKRVAKPMAAILRKQDLFDFPVEDGLIRVVQREGFIVFPGEGMRENPYFERLLNPDNLPKLATAVEDYLDSDPRYIKYGWVQPQATSVYAKFISNSELESKSAQ